MIRSYPPPRIIMPPFKDEHVLVRSLDSYMALRLPPMRLAHTRHKKSYELTMDIGLSDHHSWLSNHPGPAGPTRILHTRPSTNPNAHVPRRNQGRMGAYKSPRETDHKGTRATEWSQQKHGWRCQDGRCQWRSRRARRGDSF